MTLPVAVLAGGLGTRLRTVTGATLPKALVPVLGRPFIDYKLDELAGQGARNIVLLVGHGGDAIAEHVGDGAQFGLDVTCIADGDEPLGTGGALRRARDHLGDACWVTYGDTLLSFDVAGAEARFRASGHAMLMTVLPNEAGREPSNALVDDGLVVAYAKSSPPAGARHIDYGMLAVRTEVLEEGDRPMPFDLAMVMTELATERRCGAFEVDEPYHDIGTPDALAATTRFLRSRAADEAR